MAAKKKGSRDDKFIWKPGDVEIHRAPEKPKPKPKPKPGK